MREDDYEDTYDEDEKDYNRNYESGLEEEEEMYGLKVQLLSEKDEKRATLLETRSDSTTVRSQKKKYIFFKNSLFLGCYW